MRLDEIFDELEEGAATFAWGKVGNSVVKKYRCGGGRRAGLKVNNPADCYAPINIAQSLRMKKTRKMKGKRMTRKARRTKRTNPVSKRAAMMNKMFTSKGSSTKKPKSHKSNSKSRTSKSTKKPIPSKKTKGKK